MPKIKVINTETDETIELKAGYGANLRKAVLFNEGEVYKGLNKFLNCRGHGMCGKCVVEIEPLENVNPRGFFENIHKLEANQKLGCRVKVLGDITVKAAIVD
ncbi:MAG: 2Fe-2S iron-sulfur cluster binding domain-containing protein [Nitrospinae bacterium]|nr:2Fe-2S iron-sulfur cluster binding domain-containing protein [Nitrospinota bacterium]